MVRVSVKLLIDLWRKGKMKKICAIIKKWLDLDNPVPWEKNENSK